MKVVAGIDVGKVHLDRSVAAGPVQRYANTPEGIADLVAELARQPVVLAVYEPTGGYENPLAAGLDAAGIPACRVHPNRARAYAQAGGQLAKTDRREAMAL